MKNTSKSRVEFIDSFLKPHLLDEKTRRKLGKAIYKLGSYHESVPMDKLSEVLQGEGIIPLQEDYTAFSGFFCGREGTARIELAHSYTKYKGNNDIDTYKPIENALLIINWHKLVTKLDVNVYIS